MKKHKHEHSVHKILGNESHASASHASLGVHNPHAAASAGLKVAEACSKELAHGMGQEHEGGSARYTHNSTHQTSTFKGAYGKATHTK